MVATVRATWRLVDEVAMPRRGAANMRADVALLESVAAGGSPALRLYRWEPACLSLGRFQPDAEVDDAACARLGVDVVRRPTGGRALLHGADLTYAIALRRPPGPDGAVDAIYRHLAAGVRAGLARLGVEARIATDAGPPGTVCFASSRGSDLRVGDRKVCGSAQVHRRGVVLQHGSVLLDRLAFDETDLVVTDATQRDTVRAGLRTGTVTLAELGAPTDPRAVADALVAGFASALDLALRPTAT